MHAKHLNLEIAGSYSTYFIGNEPYETQIGRIFTLRTGLGWTYIVESHDWTSDTGAYLSGEGDGYDPIIVGTYADEAEAKAVLEQRAREATE